MAQVRLKVQNVGADGTLTDATTGETAADLQESTGDPWNAGGPLAFTTTLVADVDFGLRGTTENISSIDRPKAHNVRLAYGARFTVTEIMRQQAGQNRLAAIYANGVSKYVKVDFARGGSIWSCYALMTGYVEEPTKGRSTGQMSLTTVAIAPTYTAATRVA